MTPRSSVVVAALLRTISGVSVRWIGCRPDLRQRVYFGNHTSHLDTAILWAVLPSEVRALTRPVAARDYWGTRRLLRDLVTELFRAVLIDRENADVAEKDRQIGILEEAMGERNSLILFPEGSRQPGPEVAPFKSGLYHLSLRKPGLELVPVHLHNLYRILPKGETLPVPMLCRVTFGPPLRLVDGEPKSAFLERTRAAVQRLTPA